MYSSGGGNNNNNDDSPSFTLVVVLLFLLGFGVMFLWNSFLNFGKESVCEFHHNVSSCHWILVPNTAEQAIHQYHEMMGQNNDES